MRKYNLFSLLSDVFFKIDADEKKSKNFPKIHYIERTAFEWQNMVCDNDIYYILLSLISYYNIITD